MRAQSVSLSGTVTDKSTGAPVGFATVVVEATEQWAVADAKGKFVLRGVSAAESVIRVDCLGYVTWTREMKLGKDVNFRVELSPDNLSLESAVVTAQENGNSATTTRTIDRMALDHVQLMNVSDISSLLPGGAT
ncbi:MAG: carboxypeptidase-like regulatory domain-containing protein, partial [Bacteroidales bacterium]|nr:carboxypeptidase-like regulatory domain-containing protein [Bacteroidales bacterium]